MTHAFVGRQAEDYAARFLRTKGYKVLEQNWKTRWCEIDIVARHKQRLLLVEVKYRQKDTQGQGLDYITPQKLRQMSRAAQWYVNDQEWPGDYSLAAIEVSGNDFQITQFIEDII